MTQTLAQLAGLLGAQLVGDESLVIKRLATFDSAAEGDITFVSDKKLLSQLANCHASAIVLPTAVMAGYQGNALFMDNPYVGYAMLASIFDTTPNLAVNIADSAQIDSSAKIGNNVAIAENVVIGANVEIADNCQIFANVVIGQQVKINKQTKIYPNVTVYHDCQIGERCIIHANSVVGSDGFGNAPYQGKWVKIPQIGKVIIGDDVEIGSSTTIDRGALSDTIIKDGVKIDNQCQIAHNVVIGEHTAIAGGSNIAGSTKVGKSCIIGGGVAMNGHLTIADNVVITGDSMVVRNIDQAGIYSSGVPAIENRQWRKNTAYMLKIEDLFKRVKQLEKQLQDKD
ncbi:UDP-3-O-(3-hydroxymyristoyl)glucosamine N-acyltransferase [Psychromonas marina]|uniref:UDP-3-O-acylglucosamine N-acyltransferase n=1 Tax=Psychromonas marina TaxID=88364 RepID=A0ABQ6DWK1_9GAMM|nr:UDP-3-O-(3-hydroxymyristoyl)glucosamine N-acyltransferase [Psychromonas marina]GLS89394.1 UDP-3-O-(3-hydroxymyristoyl)glucosamine N-acyltransferase [Psychromonas marina]